MKSRLLRRLRKQAKKNIKLTYSRINPDWGFYWRNERLNRPYSPPPHNHAYCERPWSNYDRTKYYNTVEEALKDFNYVLWSETMLLYYNYRDKIKLKQMEKELKNVNYKNY